MKLGVFIVFVGLWFVAGCGSAQKSEPQVLARTEPTEDPADAGPRQDLTDRVIADEGAAAKVIKEVMKSAEGDLASWAAVYALRLGIKHEREASEAAIKRGVTSDDPLLAALCWRWLASLGVQDLPKWSKTKCDDPVVMAMAALAFAGRGKIPKELAGALGNPDGEPFGPDKRGQARARVEFLLPPAAPFDNGPLALAVTFVEARRSEWAEKGEGGELSWVCSRLLRELISLVFDESDQALGQIKRSAAEPGRGCFTDLSRRLETVLIKQPRRMLYSIAVTGDSKLKIGALRSIAIVGVKPLSGDFGAAAANLDAPETAVRLEAARTFLLLSIRSRSK